MLLLHQLLVCQHPSYYKIRCHGLLQQILLTSLSQNKQYHFYLRAQKLFSPDGIYYPFQQTESYFNNHIHLYDFLILLQSMYPYHLQ